MNNKKKPQKIPKKKMKKEITEITEVIKEEEEEETITEERNMDTKMMETITITKTENKKIKVHQ